MNKKLLGNTDLHVAPVSLGCNVFGWTIDETRSFEILDAFVAAGFNLLDTADVYSRWVPANKGGESEIIIGKWMQETGKRKDVLITTKVGSDMGDGKKGVSKEYIIRAAEDSLRRLQTDYIDLYLTHFDDEQTPVEETLEAYEKLVSAGKVRWIGTSNMSADRLIASLAASKKNGFPLYQVLEPEYNLYQREKFEKEYEQLCTDHNIGVVNYYALASGFLTGKYRSENDLGKSARGGGIKKYLNPRGMAILDALDTVAKNNDAQPASIAIAWLLSRPSITAPIASATSVGQLEDILKAAALILNQEDLNFLNTASKWK